MKASVALLECVNKECFSFAVQTIQGWTHCRGVENQCHACLIMEMQYCSPVFFKTKPAGNQSEHTSFVCDAFSTHLSEPFSLDLLTGHVEIQCKAPSGNVNANEAILTQ